MALQPLDERPGLFVEYENTDVEASQHSQHDSSNPVTTFAFSSIIDVVSEPSPTQLNNNQLSDTKDSDDIDKCFSKITPDVEERINDMINSGNFQPDDFSCNDLNWLDDVMNDLAMLGVKDIDESITDRMMMVEIQPPTNIRRRYQSDGKRQIEKSRSKPMTIKLPNLKNCKLSEDQSFYIKLVLITGEDNPGKKVYIHVDKLEYHEDDLPECNSRFVRVPLTQNDIQNGTKQLARVSIIKTKLDTYTFELIPFNPTSTENPVDIYKNQSAKSIVAEAKRFRNTYNLKSSRIACQLLIKEKEIWYTTDIVCHTDIMEEKEKQSDPKKSNKRSVCSIDSDEDEDEYPVRRQSSNKKKKLSTSSAKRLPVTRAKKSSTS